MFENFSDRLAAGDFDDAIRSLLSGSAKSDEKGPDDGARSSRDRDDLAYARRVAAATLNVLTSVEDSGGISLALRILGSVPATIPIRSAGGIADPDVRGTLEILAETEGALRWTSPPDGDLLDLIAIVPERSRLRFRVHRFPLVAEEQRPHLAVAHGQNSSSDEDAARSSLLLGPDDGKEPPLPRPRFDVDWRADAKAFAIATPAAAQEGDELLVTVTVDGMARRAFLERTDDGAEFFGWCPLPDEIGASPPADVRLSVASIDIGALASWPPREVNRWLAGRPAVVMPLSPSDDGYRFAFRASDRDFLVGNPDVILAIRFAARVAEVS